MAQTIETQDLQLTIEIKVLKELDLPPNALTLDGNEDVGYSVYNNIPGIADEDRDLFRSKVLQALKELKQ